MATARLHQIGVLGRPRNRGSVRVCAFIFASLACATLLCAEPAPVSAPPEPPESPAPAAENPKPVEPAPIPEPEKDDGPEAGDEVTVEYKDGRRLTGLYAFEDEHFITITISGIEVDIPHREVDFVIDLGTPLERYLKMRPAIADDNASRLVTLARWLQSHKLYREGLEEVGLALDSDPTNLEAWRLMRELEGQVAILESRADGPPADTSRKDERLRESRSNRDNLREKLKAAIDFDLLDEEQINLMKVYEINLNDPPTIRISRNSVERFMLQYVDHPLVPDTRDGRKAFLRKTPEEILDVMFRARAREFYGEAMVLGHPESVRIFRNRVQAGWLVNNCATSRCHGGPDVGNLWLVNRRPRSDAATYTNLLVLERTTLDDGTPLIDYERPANSALLHFGLPAGDSAYPHPEVAGWRPAFRSRDARAFEYAVSWINLMYEPRPDYSIEYVPPGMRQAERKFEPVER